METLRIEEDRVTKKLKKYGFTDSHVILIMRVFRKVDQELTDEGWSE